MPTEENDLRTRLAAGESAAFAEVYARTAKRLFATAKALVGRREEAEDIVQETFVLLARHRNKLVGVHDLDRYLFMMLRHTAYRRTKGAARYFEVLKNFAASLTGRTVERKCEQDWDPIDRAMARLPDSQREVVALKLLGELTFGKIAEMLDISANTAANRPRIKVNYPNSRFILFVLA